MRGRHRPDFGAALIRRFAPPSPRKRGEGQRRHRPRHEVRVRPGRGGLLAHRKPRRLPDVALDEEIEERADEGDRGEAPDIVPAWRAGRDDDVVGELESKAGHQPAGVAQVCVAEIPARRRWREYRADAGDEHLDRAGDNDQHRHRVDRHDRVVGQERDPILHDALRQALIRPFGPPSPGGRREAALSRLRERGRG